MKIGSIAITRQQKVKRTVEQRVGDFLRDDPRVIEHIARVARGEVKNYLAELGEKAEMPFNSPENFLAMIRTHLAAALLAEQQAAGRTISLDELERRRKQAAHNMKLVNEAFEEPPEYPFEVGGYANHPEQKEQDARPFPDPAQQNMINLNKTGFVSDAELNSYTVNTATGQTEKLDWPQKEEM